MDASPLARLPAELRSLIYEYTFTSQYAVTMGAKTTSSPQHSLTRTCRQIRDETLAMFFSMTRFNAHLDDGPTTPLARWLKAQGSDHILLLKQLDIWNMHTTTVTLLGEAATAALLQTHPDNDPTKSYVLQLVGSSIFSYITDQSLIDTILSLRDVGLGLRRICINEGHTPPPDEEPTTLILANFRMTLTRSFAVVRLNAENVIPEGLEHVQRLHENFKYTVML